MDGDTTMRLLYLVLLLMAVSGPLLMGLRHRPGATVRQLAVWAFIFLGVIAVYGLWPDIRRAAMPSRVETDGQTAILRRGDDGHFHARATVNGVEVAFLVDTGATDIVLSQADAARVGFDPAGLGYSGLAETANGTVRTAPVRLETLVLGPFSDSEVPATVSDGALDTSLLGMRYLRGFTLSIEGDRMTLAR